MQTPETKYVIKVNELRVGNWVLMQNTMEDYWPMPIEDGNRELSSWNGRNITVLDTMDVWVNNEEAPHIKYLHQLQNLFFALTGQELEVNL